MATGTLYLHIDTSTAADKFRDAAKQLSIVADILSRGNEPIECDPEPAIKQCPFCGAVPMVDGYYVCCPSEHCAASVHWISAEKWNRRAE